VFLLRIDDCGNVLWANTYGAANSDEIGWNVDEAISGSPNFHTSRGDFIVAGSTTLNAAPGTRDGYIIRTDCNGNLIWDNTYASPFGRDDYFYGVTETRQGVPPGQPGSNPPAGSNTFDIVACGGSNGFCCGGGSYDAWVVRVDGNTGAIGFAPQNSSLYVGSRDEDLRSVEELQVAPYNANLAFTGTTSSNSPNREVYVLQTLADPCGFVADRAFGDLGGNADEGYWIREVPIDLCADAPAGTLVLTGYLNPIPGAGFGAADAFVHLCSPGTLAGITTTIYGGDRDDWGWSVAPVIQNVPCYTSGYIVSGFTQSPSLIGPDPQQLYLIKTDCGLASGCNSQNYTPVEWQPNLQRCCQLPNLRPIGLQCSPSASSLRQCWQHLLCYLFDGVIFCPAPCQTC